MEATTTVQADKGESNVSKIETLGSDDRRIEIMMTVGAQVVVRYLPSTCVIT